MSIILVREVTSSSLTQSTHSNILKWTREAGRERE